MIPSRLPPSSGVGQPTIGRPFYGEAKGLLSPAGRFYGFPTGEARLSGFRRQRRHKKMASERAPTSPAQRYFIPPEGGSPEPVREASAGPGQNPWRPGPSGPAAPSTLAAKPRQPTGIQVSAESLPKAHNLKCLTQQKSTNHHS